MSLRTIRGPTRPAATVLLLVGWLVLGLFLSAPLSMRSEGAATNPSLTASAWTVTGARTIVLPPGSPGALDGVRVLQPSVVRATNGSYLMAYMGFDGSRNHLMVATSPDGLSWTRVGEAVSLNDGSGSPFVMMVAGVYQMWFESVMWGVGPMGYTDQIYHTTSSDGISWSAPTLALTVGSPGAWDGGSVGDPTVARDSSGMYRMYFTMFAANGSAAIGLATSSDLVTWTKWPGNPVFVPDAPGTWDDGAVSGPSVVAGSPWTLFFQGRRGGTADRIGYATSSDGYTWLRNPDPLLTNEAAGTWDSYAVSAPSFLAGSPTSWLFFYGDDGTGTSSIARVPLRGVEQAAPGDTSWNVAGNDFLAGQMNGTALAANGSLILLAPSNRVIAIDHGGLGEADSVYARSPFVLKDTGGSYKMWYSGYDGYRNRMLYATSPDGVHWTKHGVIMDVLTPPYSFDSVGGQSVIKIGSTYHMWFGAGYWSGGVYGYWAQIYHATSTDGANWTVSGVALAPTQSWGLGMVNAPSVVRDTHGVFWMTYFGWDGTTNRIGMATSANGTVFVPYANNPIVNLGPLGSWDSGVVQGTSLVLNGTAWTLWYEGWDGSHWQIGLAHSTDGFNWTKDSSNPGFVPEPSPAWDDVSVGYPDFLADPAGPRLYFAGYDGSYFRIGATNFSQPVPATHNGTYTSSVFDSGTYGTRWRTVAWVGDAPPGSTMDLRVRAGNDSVADATWTPWIRPIAGPVPPFPPPLENLSFPRDRFFQFQINFTSTNSTIVPWVESVTVGFALNQGPVTGIVQPGPFDWVRGSFLVSWSASDPEGDGVVQAQLQISSDPTFSYVAITSGALLPSDSPYPVRTSLQDGLWYVRVVSEDAYGAWGNWTDRAFGVDTTPPVLSVFSPTPNAVVTTSSPQVGWSAADFGSGLERVEVSVDGGTPRPPPARSSSLQLSGLADGTHTIAVRAYDVAGNVATVSVSITVDTSILNPSGPYGILPSFLVVAGISGVGAAVSAAACMLLSRRRARP